MKNYILYLLLILNVFISYSQLENEEVKPFNLTENTAVILKPLDKNDVQFDEIQYEAWQSYYEGKEGNNTFYISHLAIRPNQKNTISATFQNLESTDNIKIKTSNDSIILKFKWLSNNSLKIFLPEATSDYSILFINKKKTIRQLDIHVFNEIKEKIIIVPLVDFRFNKDSLMSILTTVYNPINLKFEIEIKNQFNTKHFTDKLSFNNPSENFDHYTHQMRRLRDVYFEKNPNASKNAYYIFLIPNFITPSIKGYMPRNKSIGFIPVNDSMIYHTIAKSFCLGIGMLDESWKNEGPKIGTTTNIMDTLINTQLTYFQWVQLRGNSSSYLYFDAEEDIKTNNGMIAYYFWEENKDGYIKLKGSLLNSIKRPFKKNYISYHLNINDILLKPLYSYRSLHICWLHIILFIITLTITTYYRRKIKRKLKILLKRPFFIIRISLFGILILGTITFGLSWKLINNQIEKHQVTSGFLKELKGESYYQAYYSILKNKNLKHDNEFTMGSEILLNHGDNWYMKRKKRVLYFNVKQDEFGKWTLLKITKDSDILKVKSLKYKQKAESHYLVFNYINKNGKIEKQKVFNHSGTDITDKIIIQEDLSKRILLFVNGYRPSSIGHTFEETFQDIEKNGLEFPNSLNLIYTFDRYNYWRPWNNIDVLFQNRINPNETFYADGHFSVETSNYKSLVKFTTSSTNYPKRCKNQKKHTCFKVKKEDNFWSWFTSDNTVDLLPTKSNKKGFNIRYINGKVAGKNLLQMINEIPNRSENDTLFIIAHSMGYAYALGMIEELQHKINLGEFYIIAPENAESGPINIKKWNKVYQYGVDHKKLYHVSPCMLDGIAPQTKIPELPKENQIFIPEMYYKRFGFFDSHFIGYYTWILDIKPDKPGYIRQR
ncbi:MAG: hypothetical protein HYR91_11660 [Flavobacteriia bacterium]|nr:hypothetical protein [Flavobacteriia bacterium]